MTIGRINIGSKSRLQHIDGVRALAATFVMLNHGFRFPWPNVPAVSFEQHPEGILLILTSWMRYGHFAVTVFIAISGYCLMLPFVQSTGLELKTVGRFYGRRVWRVLPTYYSALILSLALIFSVIGFKTGTQWDACLPVTMQGILARIFLIQDIFIIDQINNPLWAIATMFRIYLAFPFVLFLFQKLEPMVATFFIVFGTLALQYFRPFPYSDHITVAYFAIFSMGCLGAYVQDDVGDRFIGFLRCGWISVTIFLAVFFLILPFSQSLSFWRIADYGVGFSTVALLMDLYRRPQSKMRVFLSNAYLTCIGKFSFSIYLMHFPFQALVWIYMLHPLSISLNVKFVLFLFTGFPVVTLLCWLFYLIFERPLARFQPAILRSR